MADSNRSLARIALAIALCVLVSGCKMLRPSCHKPAAYQSAQTGDALKIPPGLEAPDTTQSLPIPELEEPAPPLRKEGDPCLDGPPPYATPKPAPEPAA
jgi:uncharacterized lipoprotein